LILLVELDGVLVQARTSPSMRTRAKPSRLRSSKSLVLALAPEHHGREHVGAPAPCPRLHDLVGHLVGRLALDHAPALGAVRGAHARVQQAQVVVDLGDGAHRGAGVAARRLLVDGDGRRQAVDAVEVGLVHLAQEHARVAGEALNVAALPLGVDGVEGEARLARAREAGDDDELVARNV
jgi:hypothetical protein